MTEKRYTVFVSSTFRDLVEERQAALRAILALGHFPTGMEVFPAAGNTPWEVISRVIADADYYVLIIAGRYGSTTTEGVSYTEREYEEALRLDKCVLAFLHEDPNTLPAVKSELSLKPRRLLERFRKKVTQAHTCKFWKDSNELALQVTQSLLNAFDLNPAAGWVRSGGPDIVRLLSELNELRQKIDVLRDENLGLREQLKAAPQTRVKDFTPEEPTLILFDFSSYGTKNHEVNIPWGRVFFSLAPSLLEGSPLSRLRNLLAEEIIADESVQKRFPADVARASQYKHALNEIHMSEESLQTVLLGLMARGLVTNRKEWYTYTTSGRDQRSRDITMWYLTPEGQRLYLEQKSK
jgi:hypothetical protein